MDRLLSCPEFAARYHCRLFTNYVREPIPPGTLENCDLFLYQHLGEKWDEFASASLLRRVSSSAQTLCIPNMFFSGYWPFWSGAPGFNYRDSYLDSLLDAGLSGEEILLLFLRSPLATRFDLASLLEETLAQERSREAHTPIKYVDKIEQDFRTRKLFTTVNHPGPELLNHVASTVLVHLGFAPPDMTTMPDAYPEFEQPIHPHVAAFHGLDFADATTEYMVYGLPMTFAHYVARYVEARQEGITDFIEYLARC